MQSRPRHTERSTARRFAAVLAIVTASFLGTAGPGLAEDGPQATATVESPLELGVFTLGSTPVIDADTIRLADGRTVRVHGIDAEETFKNARHREAAAKNFAAYAAEMRGTSKRPVKYGTPLGEAAAAEARRLLSGAREIRLELDHGNERGEDTFGRLLAHVVVLRPEGEFLLAESLLRGGFAPYFVKYGRSRRFDARFRAAQDAARAARRGIWSASTGHYPDYPERLAWWEDRAAQLDRWRDRERDPAHVTLDARDAEERLAALTGREAVVLGSLERLLESEDSPRKILFLVHRPRRAFPVVVFRPQVWSALDLDSLVSRYVAVRGQVTIYRDRPQIVVTDPAQIVFP